MDEDNYMTTTVTGCVLIESLTHDTSWQWHCRTQQIPIEMFVLSGSECWWPLCPFWHQIQNSVVLSSDYCAVAVVVAIVAIGRERTFITPLPPALTTTSHFQKLLCRKSMKKFLCRKNLIVFKPTLISHFQIKSKIIFRYELQDLYQKLANFMRSM